MKSGFTVKPLQSLCDDFKQDIVDGPFGSELQRKDYITEGVPVLKIQNVKPFAIELKKMDYVSAGKFRDLRRHSFRRGDIVMTKLGSPLGVSAVVDDLDEGLIVADLVRIRAQRINTKYLCYHLNSQRTIDFINSMQKGTTRPRVTLSVVRELPIYAPPLAEQERLVRLLDESFAGLATAKANAKKNLQNARALFQSHVESVFEDAWRTSELVTLADLATDITDGDHLPPPKSPTGIPFITIGNVVKETGQIDFSDTFTVSRQYYDALKPSKKPRHGDVLYTVTGSYGIPVMVPEGVEFCFQRHIGLIRPKAETSSSWLYYLLLSPQVFKQANAGATGAAQRTVSLKILRSFVVPKVSLKQQKTVAEKLEALAEKTQSLAHLYERKLTALEELKQSLLHEAFTGQLTARHTTQSRSTVGFELGSVAGYTSTELHAGILAMAIAQHEKRGKLSLLTHVKAEKIAHMVEARLGLDLGRAPAKDAAGPNDFPHLKKVEHRARMANYFEFKCVAGAYRVEKRGGFDRFLVKTREALGERCEDVESLLRWMVSMTPRQAEIVATVFAAWNNLLLEGKRPTDERIVLEARENWHPEKLKIDRASFFSAVKWLREQGCVPEGTGKVVTVKDNSRERG